MGLRSGAGGSRKWRGKSGHRRRMFTLAPAIQNFCCDQENACSMHLPKCPVTQSCDLFGAFIGAKTKIWLLYRGTLPSVVAQTRGIDRFARRSERCSSKKSRYLVPLGLWF